MIDDDTIVTVGMLRRIREKAIEDAKEAALHMKPMSQIWLDHTPNPRKVQQIDK